ncbi:GSCOCT00013103001.2-RA-CDS [Cotesia congregata]|uniref:Cc_crp.4_35.2 n=1 Tax=Cotesia congregata TaxID=51543 RepID=S6D9L2_COTCN|nr:GSCOCT00013103001.2-RA-CDS [Cotesia congregata]CAG5092546.1 cc_crp.4_35.2 [Cotesia congregata]CCQ71266.1 hypothetical protein CRP4 [Cotesia congregata]
MRVLTVIFLVFIIASAIVTTSGESEKPVECLKLKSNCDLRSNSCCQESEIGNSSSLVKKIHCDYLGKRVCLEADQIYRYDDVILIKTYKDDPDLNFYYDKYVNFLLKIEERLVLKPFMDRMYASPFPRRNNGYGKM